MSQVKKILSWIIYYVGFCRGPRPGATEAVNRSLQGRPSLSIDDWFLQYWKTLEVPKEVVDFVYEYLPEYSGVDFSRVIPSDRLIEDLHFDEVCWDDWDEDLRDDFRCQFHVDIFKAQVPQEIHTVQQLVYFLARALTKKSMSGENLGDWR